MEKKDVIIKSNNSIQKVFPEFKCLCGDNFFIVKTCITPLKKKYKLGQKFDVTRIRKRLKCVNCGRQYWENQVHLTDDELRKVIKPPMYDKHGNPTKDNEVSRLREQTKEKR
jgi:hypothetical protein